MCAQCGTATKIMIFEFRFQFGQRDDAVPTCSISAQRIRHKMQEIVAKSYSAFLRSIASTPAQPKHEPVCVQKAPTDSIQGSMKTSGYQCRQCLDDRRGAGGAGRPSDNVTAFAFGELLIAPVFLKDPRNAAAT
jgi:hypothetical protein